MKNAKDIIQSIQNQPQFQKLQTYTCIKTILGMFLPSLHRFIAFSYIKNETLFIVLNHNGGKQEFDNNIKMIKEVLKYKKPQECSGEVIRDIKTFLTHKPRKKAQAHMQVESIPYYKERSSGNFDISTFSDEKLQNVAKAIREIIKSNAHS